jgi:succinoglycan biosynthesis transport protein ExoP
VAILTSDRIIDRTVTDPKLISEAPRWSSQFIRNGRLDSVKAAKKLKKNLSAGIMGETELIRLSFWWTDPDEATAVLKLVSQTYSTDRFNQSRLDVNQRKQQIMTAISETEAQIKILQDRKLRMMFEKQTESLDQQHTAAMRQIDSLSTMITEVRAQKEMVASQLRQFQEELRSPSGPTIPDSVRKRVEDDYEVVQIKNELNSLEAGLTRLAKQGIGPEQRDYIRVKALVEARRQNLGQVRERLQRELFDAQIDSLKTAYDAASAQEADALSKLEAQKTKAIELTQLVTQVKDIDGEIRSLTDNKAKYGQDLKSVEVLTPLDTSSRVVVQQDAQRPKSPSFPKLYIMIPLGLVLCLGLVGGGVLLIEIVDQRVKTAADVAAIPRTRVLGMIPHSCEDPTACERIETVFRDRPAGVLAENFRQIRAQVLKKMTQGGHKSLLVVAGSPGAGATTVVINLAQAIAAAEHKVLVIDANFRRPGVHRVLGLSEQPGLSDVLAGEAGLWDAVQSSGTERFDVLAAGTPGVRVIERLGTEAIASLLKEAGTRYDIVLLDVAPAAVAGDGMSLANRCDATVLVVRALAEKRGMVVRLRNELGEAKAEFMGVVVNAVRSAAGGYLRSNILAAHTYQAGPAAPAKN